MAVIYTEGNAQKEGKGCKKQVKQRDVRVM